MSACPVHKCMAPAKPGRLMCLSHWRLVADPLQQRVWSTYRAARRPLADRTYIEAARDATEAVNASLGNAGARNSYHLILERLP